ncbi:MAG: hypothetical protein R3Y08_05695, partial [Rikenellaceae bacterium]
MKKFLFLVLACCVGSTVAVNAQEASNEKLKEVVVKTNPLADNWFIQLGGGAVYFEGEFGTNSGLMESVNPTAELFIGKWITPSIGFRAGAEGWYLSTTSRNETKYSEGLNDNGYYDERYDLTNIRLDAMLNLSSAIYGYKEDTFYNCIPYVGFGVMQRYTSIWSNDLAATLGLLNSFYLSPSFDFYVDFTFSSFKNSFSYLGRTNDFSLSTTVGLTYKIKKRGWESAEPREIYTGISE